MTPLTTATFTPNGRQNGSPNGRQNGSTSSPGHQVIGRGGPSSLDIHEVGTRPGATDSDEGTGPMPVLDLADGHLHVWDRRGVTVVELDGGLDDALAAVLAPAIEAAVAEAEAVILDLDHVTLLDRTAFATVSAALDAVPGDHARCIVAGRLSGRLVLERWFVPDSYAVFTSVPDALQARTFIESGYGHGWHVDG